MWLLAMQLAAEHAEAHPPDSLANQIKRGLTVQPLRGGEVQFDRMRLFSEVAGLSAAKLDRMLNQEEWLAIGVIETKTHGRLRVLCHIDRCVASSNEISIELLLVKADQTPSPRRKPKKQMPEATASSNS